MSQTLVGLEVLARTPQISAHWGACGLVCNQASVTTDFVPAFELCRDLWGERLRVLFGPQHGFWGTAQDNMIETPHTSFGSRGIPLYSLYSETREPSADMLAPIETLVIDLQVTGCRIYTFKSTIAACLRAAKRHGKRVVVLDRPNPLGGVDLEGRCLDPDMKSFVGEFVMPMRHGLTAGEAALFFNREIGAELEVIRLEGWDATKDYRATGRPWVITSPNLPTLDPVFVYPGTVMFEGTNVSEGRGTGLPFQFFGAPYVTDTNQLKRRILHYLPDPAGVVLRECCFEPTSGKGQREVCRGLQLHVVAPEKVRSYTLALAMIKAFRDVGGDAFAWKQPPYEYDYQTLPMKLIIGSKDFESHLDAFDRRDPFWHEGVSEFAETVKPLLLYPRTMRFEAY